MDALRKIGLIQLVENAPIAIVIHSIHSVIRYANPVAEQLLGSTLEQLVGKEADDPRWHFVDEFGIRLSVKSHPVCSVAVENETITNQVIGIVYDDDKQTKWLSVTAYPEAHLNKEEFIVATYVDISHQKNQFLFRDVVEHAQDVVLITEAHAIDYPFGPNIVYVNKAFETLTGYTAQEVIGKSPRILQGKSTSRDSLNRIKQALRQEKPVSETIMNYGKNGRPYWLQINIVPLKNKFGKVTHFGAIERDVTEQRFHAEQLENSNIELGRLKDSLQALVDSRTSELKSANVKLERLAYYDFLTQLPNRRSFQDCFERQLSLAKRNRELMLIGIIDLDDFKNINDSYGHEVGDQVLKLVAKSIKNVVRQEDSVGRIGGEEFAFSGVIEESSDIELLCQRMLTSIRTESIQTDTGELIFITASIGVYAFTPDKSTTWIDVYKNADTALYIAKAESKNCFREYKKMDLIEPDTQ